MLFFAAAQAQTVTYDVLLDTDRNATSGCSATPTGQGDSSTGFERRIRSVVDASTLTVTEVSVASCDGAAFGPPTVVGGPHPVGLNNGVNGTDVVELSASLNSLAPLTSGVLEVTVTGDDAVGSDVLATTTGAAGGDPILVFLPVAVPALGLLGLLLLIGAIAVITVRGRSRKWLSISLLAASGIVLATIFVVDGDVSDWGGANPDASDPANDSTNGAAGNDIQAFFAALDNDTLFFRIDVTDLENQPPIAVDDAFNVLEDNTLNVAAPGVLANDSDPDMDPITAVLVSGPTDAQAFTLNADGSFDYTPAADFFGTDSFTYAATDGGSNSDPATVTITVDPVNDAPSFTIPADATVLEDAGPQSLTNFATNILAGPANESGQVLTFNITGNDNAALFQTLPALSSDGTLTFTSADDAFGVAMITVELMDDGGTANGGVDTSPPQTFAINVDPVNDAPSFTGGPDQTVLEDAGAQTVPAWATAISAGPANESGQVLTFNVTANDNPALFSAGPAVDGTSGDLTFTTAADANGTANITIELMDDGGTANGGVDTSAPFSFVIDVTPVNDAPEFTLGADQTVLEDAGAQSVNGFASGISAGPPDESGQILTFNIVGNDNPALFSAGPALDAATGNLTYTPAADANGTANIMVELMDDGGTANGGVDTSAAQGFAINVTPVNDSPSFSAGADPAASNEDAGAQSLPWATAIVAGPADEGGQALTFILNQTAIDSTLSFTTAPSVNVATGNVEFEAAANAYGMVSYNVTLMDNGGTANGGVDTFGPVALTITVNPVNDPPTVSVAPILAATTNIALDVPAGSGLLLNASDDPTEAADPNGPAAPGTNLTVGNAGNPAPTTTTMGGDLNINTATGAFTYNPPAGVDTGMDTFDFVVCDDGIPGPGLCSATVTATINLSGNTVWFVDNSAGSPGDGRLTTPFDSLAAFNAQQNGGGTGDPAAGDFIFLFSGSGEYNDGANGITLLNDQTLFGQGTTGTTFDAFTGITPPGNSAPRPALGGARPILTSTGDGVNLNTGAANSNTLRGFNIGDTTNHGISGVVAGTLNASQVDIINDGGLADINGGGTGTLNAAFGAFSSANSPAPFAFNVFNFNTGTLSATSTSVTTPAAGAFQMTNNASTAFDFGNLATVLTTNGAGFVVDSAASVTISPPAPVTVQTVGGPALDLANSTFNGFNFGSVSANTTTTGVSLNNVSGFISSGGGNIQNTTGDAFVITGGASGVTYGGTITNAAGRSVVVTGHTGGNVVLNPVNDTGQGIFLNNNAGTNFFFAGTMTLNTGANNAFTATNGGTIDATGVGSTITTSTGVAVNIDGVSIRNTGFTVQSVSANGATSGIVLNNTGSAGGLTVAGDGSNARNGTGGTIQNTQSHGIMLTQTSNVRLASMNILAPGQGALGNDTGHGIRIRNLSGASNLLNGLTIEAGPNSGDDGVEVINTNTNLGTFTNATTPVAGGLTVTNSLFDGSPTSDGFFAESRGTSNMGVIINGGSRFTDIRGDGIQISTGALAGDVHRFDITVMNSQLDTASIPAPGGNNGIALGAAEPTHINFMISGNTIFDVTRGGSNAGAVNVITAGNNSLYTGMLQTTDMDNTGDQRGNNFVFEGTSGVQNRGHDVTIDNNDIDNLMREGNFLTVSGGQAVTNVDFVVTNNRVGTVTPVGITTRESFEIDVFGVGAFPTHEADFLVDGNTHVNGGDREVADMAFERNANINLIVTNNSFTQMGAGAEEVEFDTFDAGVNLCLHLDNNTVPAGGGNEYDLDELAGTFTVEDLANVAARNTGDIDVGAGITSHVDADNQCTVPN